MGTYVPPSVTDLGSLAELTQTNIYKTSGSGDVIYVNGVPQSAPGGQVTSTS